MRRLQAQSPTKTHTVAHTLFSFSLAFESINKINRTRHTPNRNKRGSVEGGRWELGEGQGPHLHEQDLVRTIRDTGERERGAHRDTEGGWAGFTHTTGSQGFLSRIGQVAPGGTGAGAGLLLVALS